MAAQTIVDAAPARLEPTLDETPLCKPDWQHGLRLMPQHFQAQDRYHEELVSRSLHLAFDRPWGLTSLAIDEEALATGQLVVQRLSAILPDGTPILASASRPVAPRSLDAHLRDHATLDVYVALLLDVPGRAALEAPGESLSRHRWAPDAALVPDYNTGQSPIAIPWARPNVRLLFQDEPLETHSVLQIARVRTASSGRPELDPTFIPPVLRVRASSGLEASLRTLEKTLLAMHGTLLEQRSTGAEMTGADAARMFLLMTLGRLLAALGDVIGTPGVHPREAYRVLAELVGALSAYGPTGTADVPPFDYLDLGTTFGALLAQAHGVAESLSAPRHRNVLLHRQDEQFWYVELREPSIFDKEFLLVVTGEDATTMRMHLPRLMKVGAWDEIGSLVQSAIPGVGIVAEPHHPSGVPVSAGAACFRLNKQTPAWQNVISKRSLGIFVPLGFKTTQVLLLVLEPGIFG